jgi:hypothetical protein
MQHAWRREFGGARLPGRDGYPRIGSVCRGAAGACSAAEGPAVRTPQTSAQRTHAQGRKGAGGRGGRHGA